MRYKYDFALAGSTGQIGRVLYHELAERGTVYQLRRGDDLSRIPRAKHVINAAGYTKFDHHIERYWQDNIRYAVELATWAVGNESFFHQFSSEAVAEYRNDVLTESLFSTPRAHPKMIDYALSKVLVEEAVKSIVDTGQLSIYRLSDFVPSPGRFAPEWRANHWLTILFRAGKDGFAPGDEFPVWIASVGDMSRAITRLVEMTGRRPVYHLLGHVYYWRQFQDAASGRKWPHQQRLVDTVTPVIRIDPPLQRCISQNHTLDELGKVGFAWEYLELEYWQQYAAAALV